MNVFSDIYIDRAGTLALLGALVLLFFIFELIRKRRLLERYALLWLLSGVVILGLSLSRSMLDRVAGLMGIYYPPSALFVVASLFFLVILLHFSVVTSQLTEKNRELAQRLALMDRSFEVFRKKLGEDN